jgi:hypothetical protein
MAYQEVTTTSYGKRVGNSFKGIGGGIILFIAATILLWWNEGRAVKTTKMLNEAQGAYVEMENPSKIDPALDGELVHATAVATTQDSLIDSRFGFGATAISLQRDVEYYQWVEHSESKSEDKLGGKEVTTTTYTYTKEWVPSPIQSSAFKDPDYQNKNMVLTTVEAQDQWAENVSFGAYKLNPSLIHSISSSEPVQLAIDERILKDLNDGIARIQKADSLNYVHQDGNVLYIGRVPSSPEVGDVRVSWKKIVPAKVSIISQVDGDSFKAYKAKNGKTFQTLVMGKRDASEIFESEHSTNKLLLWVLRIVGIFLVVAGLKGIFGFLETLLKVLPFLANILGWGVGVVCWVVGLVWSLIVIALAWLFYRPVLGIGLLAVAAFLIWVFAFKGKDKLKEMAGKTPNAPAPEA